MQPDNEENCVQRNSSGALLVNEVCNLMHFIYILDSNVSTFEASNEVTHQWLNFDNILWVLVSFTPTCESPSQCSVRERVEGCKRWSHGGCRRPPLQRAACSAERRAPLVPAASRRCLRGTLQMAHQIHPWRVTPSWHRWPSAPPAFLRSTQLCVQPPSARPGAQHSTAVLQGRRHTHGDIHTLVLHISYCSSASRDTTFPGCNRLFGLLLLGQGGRRGGKGKEATPRKLEHPKSCA